MGNKTKSKKVIISASASQRVAIEKWIKYWENRGYKVINYPVQIKNKDFPTVWPRIHKKFYKSLLKSDTHFIANEDKNNVAGYIGVGVFTELSFTVGLNFSRKKKIEILIHKMPNPRNIFYKDIMLWTKLGWIKLLDDKNLSGSRKNTRYNMPAKRTFKPKRGQIDYRKIRWAPVINCVVKCGKKFLVVKRSNTLYLYPGYWNGVSGFLDDRKNLRQKVREELREELGISPAQIKRIRLGEIFDQDAPLYKKTWIVHPVLVEIHTDKIKLDWEAENYRWVTPGEANRLKLLPGFPMALKRLSQWLK